MTLVKFSFVAEVGQKFQKMKHKKTEKIQIQKSLVCLVFTLQN